jgi:hypothetical protein
MSDKKRMSMKERKEAFIKLLGSDEKDIQRDEAYYRLKDDLPDFRVSFVCLNCQEDNIASIKAITKMTEYKFIGRKLKCQKCDKSYHMLIGMGYMNLEDILEGEDEHVTLHWLPLGHHVQCVNCINNVAHKIEGGFIFACGLDLCNDVKEKIKKLAKIKERPPKEVSLDWFTCPECKNEWNKSHIISNNHRCPSCKEEIKVFKESDSNE